MLMVALDYKGSQGRKVKLEKEVKRVKLEKEGNKAFRENKDCKYINVTVQFLYNYTLLLRVLKEKMAQEAWTVPLD